MAIFLVTTLFTIPLNAKTKRALGVISFATSITSKTLCFNKKNYYKTDVYVSKSCGFKGYNNKYVYEYSNYSRLLKKWEGVSWDKLTSYQKC